MSIALDRCYKCNGPFNFNPPFELMTTVCCDQVFHFECVENYVKKYMATWGKAEIPCSGCQREFQVSQSGIHLEAIWSVFKSSLNNYPLEVQSIFTQLKMPKKEDLKNAIFSNSDCGICSDPLGDLNISYRPSDQLFIHTTCQENNEPLITPKELVGLTKELAKTHSEIATLFIPPKKDDRYCTLT